MMSKPDTPEAVASNAGLGLRAPTEQDVLAKMRLHRPNWNAFGMSREGAVDLAIKCALELAATEVASLRAALQWYADGEHFTKADPDAWDTVSGEPQNWWCDDAGTAMVEDGSLAGMVLAGKLTGAQLGAPEDGEVAKA